MTNGLKEILDKFCDIPHIENRDELIQQIKDYMINIMPQKKNGILRILDKNGKGYYTQKDLPRGAYNEAIDECIQKIQEA